MLPTELGKYPIDSYIKSRMIGFWISIINSNKISKMLYNFHFNEVNAGHTNKWMNYIKKYLFK